MTQRKRPERMLAFCRPARALGDVPSAPLDTVPPVGISSRICSFFSLAFIPRSPQLSAYRTILSDTTFPPPKTLHPFPLPPCCTLPSPRPSPLTHPPPRSPTL